MRLRGVLFAVLGMCVALAAPAVAQQTGAISGKVVDTGGGVLPGVTVEARVRRAAGAARHRHRRRTASIACRRCRRATTP